MKSILINKAGNEMFAGKTRHDINIIAGDKSPESQLNRQANLLADLKEMMIWKGRSHKHDNSFTIEARARLV